MFLTFILQLHFFTSFQLLHVYMQIFPKKKEEANSTTVLIKHNPSLPELQQYFLFNPTNLFFISASLFYLPQAHLPLFH